MSFTILACSDIRAQKVNLEFPFDGPPSSLEELRRVIEETFRGEEEAIKRAGGYTDTRACEPFTINRLQKYNDDTQSWAEVTSPQMLSTYDQLYVFRKNTTKADIATERELPAPRRSPFFSNPRPSPTGTASYPRGPSADPQGGGVYGSSTPMAAASSQAAAGGGGGQYGASPSAASTPYRFPNPNGGSALYNNNNASQGDYLYPYNHGATGAGTANAAALPPPLPLQQLTGAVGGGVLADGSLVAYRERTTPERVEYLFRFADQSRQGSLSARDFELIFRAADVRFPSAVVYDLFQHFARPGAHGGEARAGLDDFQRYATDFPVAVNIAYQRISNQEREEAMVAAQRDTTQRVSDLQRQVKDLEERLAAAQRELQRQADQKSRLQGDLEELYRQRDPEYCRDEQQLLDKEVSVFKYRERLSKEEQDYERMAMERRRRTVHQATADSSPVTYGRSGAGNDGRYGPV